MDDFSDEFPDGSEEHYGRMHGDRDSAVPDYDDPIYQGW
jgi:hypothetical protein